MSMSEKLMSSAHLCERARQPSTAPLSRHRTAPPMLKHATRHDFTPVFQGVCMENRQKKMQIQNLHEKMVQKMDSKFVDPVGPTEVLYPIPLNGVVEPRS